MTTLYHPDGPVQAVYFTDYDRIGPVCWCGGCAEDPCTMADHEAKAYTYGAAALVGLIGMAEAIRRRRRKCPTCRCMISIAADECGCCVSSAADAELDDFFEGSATPRTTRPLTKRTPQPSSHSRSEEKKT